jgi:hypothetical protein
MRPGREGDTFSFPARFLFPPFVILVRLLHFLAKLDIPAYLAGAVAPRWGC